MENNKGKQQGELCAELGGSAASRVQPATPHPERRTSRERLGGETRHTQARKNAINTFLLFSPSLSPDLFMFLELCLHCLALSRGDGGFCSAPSRTVFRPALDAEAAGREPTTAAFM